MDDPTRSFSADTSLNTRDLADAFLKASNEIARQNRQAQDDDPFGYVLNRPHDTEYAVPHQVTFAAVWNWYLRYYYNYYDESQIDSIENSIAMRHDGFIQELLRHRQLPTCSLKHVIKCEDEDDEGQVKIRKELTRVVDALPYFQRFKLNLLEALFYGKAGNQVLWTRKKIGGKAYLTMGKHVPVNGDKIVYDWNGNPGILIYKGADIFNDPRAQKYIQYIDKGPALFFRDDYYRDRFVIHEFEPSDTDYLFESEKALAVHGLGIRDRYYWCWNMRAEIWAWMMNALQRIGANGMLYAFYAQGDAAAQRATMQALKDLVQENVAAFPKGLAEQLNDIIGHIEPSAVGYDVLYNIITHLEEIMRRGILGQNLSSKSAATGLGSGVADFQAGTFEDIIIYDSTCLAETIDDQLVQKIIKFNTWEYEGKLYRGDDLPFGLRFELQVDRQNVMEMIQAAQVLHQMGVPLDMEDLRDKAGLSAPKSKATTLVMPGGASGDTTNQQAIHNEMGGQPQKQLPNQNGATQHSLEHFAAVSPLAAISYELANIDADYLIQGWYHAPTNRVWVSINLNTPINILMNLSNALEEIVGIDRYKIVAEKEPVGAGWEKIDTSIYVIEPEWFSATEVFARNPCGDSAGGFEKGNTCQKGSSLSKDDVADLIANQHHNKDKNLDRESIQDKWIKSDTFTLMEIPIDIAKPASQVKEGDTSKSSGPIVVDKNKTGLGRHLGMYGAPADFLILDGKHRHNEAVKAGKKTIQAYVGDKAKKDIESIINKRNEEKKELSEHVKKFFDLSNTSPGGSLSKIRTMLPKEEADRIQAARKALRTEGTPIPEDIKKEYLEEFSRNECGDGPGGFEHGNTCASGGTKTAEKPESSRTVSHDPAPSSPGALNRAGAAGSTEIPKPNFGKSSANVIGGNLKTNEDIKKYLQRTKTLPSNWKAKDFATLAGATDDAKVTIHSGPDQGMRNGAVIVKVNDYNTGKYYSARLFDVNGKGEKFIKNIYFFVKQSGDRGKGLGIEVFGRQIDEAIEKGFSYIKCSADRNDSENPELRMNGYETWPKYGYDGEIPDRIKRLAQEAFPGVEMVSDLYKTKEGREWWKKNGVETEMVFDLREGSQSRRVWEAYLKKRFQEGSLPTRLMETMKSSMKSGTKSDEKNAIENQENVESFARDHSDPGVMIALPIPSKLAQQLTIPDGEHAQDLHVTLAYLGRVSELSPEIISTAKQITEILSQHWFPLAGLIAGAGRFSASPSSDGKDVIYANVDVPSLDGFRNELIHVLKLADIPFKNNHGFTPHVTLKYIGTDEESPVERIATTPVVFDKIAFYVGGVPHEFEFAKSAISDLDNGSNI